MKKILKNIIVASIMLTFMVKVNFELATDVTGSEITTKLAKIGQNGGGEINNHELAKQVIEDEINAFNISEDSHIILSNREALSYLALVNRHISLASDFTPSDLSTVNVQSINGSHLLRVTAARAAERLFNAAYVEEGHVLLATSGYRSFITQELTHNHWINVLGLEQARRVSARPGHSEHQLGLALDLSTHALGGILSKHFSSTPEGLWVRNNAHRFGFIIRYPQNREVETGFVYEPWHIRYVGVEAATEIFNTGKILEEFLKP